MVSGRRLLRTGSQQRLVLEILLFLQFLAVIGVCLNHLPITFLKDTPGNWSGYIFLEPAVWGIGFLFMSSGYITLSRDSALFSPTNARVTLLESIFRRFWRLALPSFLAIAMDYGLILANGGIGSNDPQRALPFELTLSQSWFYKPLGLGSITEPMMGSNMAWFGSSLFFLFLVYAFTRKFWLRVGQRAVCSLLALFAAGEFFQNALLSSHTAGLNAWTAEHYGSKLDAAYGLHYWLTTYSPYGQLIAFLSGVALANLASKGPQGMTVFRNVGLFIGIAVAMFGAEIFTRAWGFNLALISLISRLPRVSHVALSRSSARKWLRFTRYSYEVFILHLVVFDLVVLAFGVPKYRPGGLNLTLRTLFGAGSSIAICCIIAAVLLDPIRNRINAWARVERIDDGFA
jgi:hypothetical protein